MNLEALTQEIQGQTLKLLELYTKKDSLIKTIETEKEQLIMLDGQIRELNGIIQTLNFTLQTNGFTNLPADSQKQPVNPPGRVIPTIPKKDVLGEGDGKTNLDKPK